jgi:hypothetical protein
MQKISFKIFVLSFFILHSSFFISQTNLVPNPSFETYTACPNGPAQIPKAQGWFHNGSSDYFNACDLSNSTSVPFNFGGYQTAASGVAYAGIATYYSLSGNAHELLSQALTSTLSIGTKYFISFKTCLSICSSANSNCATNKIGTMFLTKPFSGFNSIITNNVPVYSNAIITDTINWTKVFGSFIADSAYTQVLIGNFFSDSNTSINQIVPASYDIAYYYVDDVCVSTDSLFTLNYFPTAVNDFKNQSLKIQIHPNPVSESFKVYGIINDTDFIILNIYGEGLMQGLISKKQNSIEVPNLNPGVYYLFLNESGTNQTTTIKFIK